jgi:hypothetical protein
MKAIYRLFAFVLAGSIAAGTVACKNEPPVGPTIAPVQFTVTPSTLDFGAEESTAKTVTVTSELPWTVESDEDWAVVTPPTGEFAQMSSFTVSVEKNETAESRTANIVVRNGPEHRVVTVTQYEVGGGGPSSDMNVTYTDVETAFLWDNYGTSTGYFEVVLFNETGDRLVLGIVTEPFQDKMKAHIPGGEYTFSAAHIQGTISEDSSISYLADGDEQYAAVTGGKINVDRKSVPMPDNEYLFETRYDINAELVLENGMTLKGTLTDGNMNILPDYGMNSTVTFDANAPASVEKIKDGLWRLTIGVFGDEGFGASFDINSAADAQNMPESNMAGTTPLPIPFAEWAGEGQPRTIEPGSITRNVDNEEVGAGTFFYSAAHGGYFYALTGGAGMMTILWTGDKTYDITFEFYVSDGRSISGTYSGVVEGGRTSNGGGGDPIENEIFKEAFSTCAGTMGGMGLATLGLMGEKDGEQCDLIIPAVIYNAPNDEEYITNGTYTYSETASDDMEPLTFGHGNTDWDEYAMLVLNDETMCLCEGGTIKVTVKGGNAADGYNVVIETDLEFTNSVTGEPVELKTSYDGVLIAQ